METSAESGPKATRLWNEREAAEYLGLSVEFLQADRGKPKERRRIAFIKLGRAVRYDPADVIAFKDRCKVQGGKQ